MMVDKIVYKFCHKSCNKGRREKIRKKRISESLAVIEWCAGMLLHQCDAAKAFGLVVV